METPFINRGLGGCRLLQHKIESKQKELQMEVKFVINELEKVLDFVKLILERGEVLANSMKSGERKFVPCSQGLARLDDQVTLLRSLVADVQSREVKAEVKEVMMPILVPSDLLNTKVQRKFVQLQEGSNMLVEQVKAFQIQLSCLVEQVVGNVQQAVKDQNLADSFTLLSKELAEAELEVSKGLQAVSECQGILSDGVWKGKPHNQNTGKFHNFDFDFFPQNKEIILFSRRIKSAQPRRRKQLQYWWCHTTAKCRRDWARKCRFP